jgi:peptidoglycan/LPS O-acetylase OafA/YrhL
VSRQRCSPVLPNYRVLAAAPLAYICIYGGLSLGRFARLRWQHDLSYGTYIYAFPVQQLLLVGGMSVGWVGFASVSVVAVLPLSAVSWFLVERPAQRLQGARSLRAFGAQTALDLR